MGRRSYFSKSPEFYNNFHKMMSDHCVPHEGEPTISLEMMESYLTADADESEKYMRMFRMISLGLEAQECGIAKYEDQVRDEN
ncbi:MAG: hypothetical protein C0603_10720 [Denitrovibrio sp.]|nr:MAG: hypothetical protein C0603_10720 [Denitrovibrio sp.]